MPPRRNHRNGPRSAAAALIAVDARDAAIPPEALAAAHERARRQWKRRRGVVEIHWGLKRVGGRTTPRRALVVTVEQKLPREQLGLRRPFPHELAVPWGGRTYYVPVDVDELDQAEKHADVRPGKGSRVRAHLRGTLSAVIVRGNTADVYLSGHVAGSAGAKVWASSQNNPECFLGRVAANRFRNNEEVDCAVVEGVALAVAKRLSKQPTAVRPLTMDDIGIPIRVGATSSHWSAVHDINAPAQFGAGGLMIGLIRLEHRVSERGDSGAPAFDAGGQLVGFVVGASTHNRRSHTYLLTATRGLNV
ncbi:MAG: hypothetical protein KC486_16910 [Myxococcales bacterium]|nr:hypothetical protein [Myxococcales bacterium]